MYTQINNPDFKDAFDIARRDDFSSEGLDALFTYLENFEDVTGTTIELDVIALCGEYLEYDSMNDVLQVTGEEYEQDLRDKTTVIECSNGHVIIESY